MTLTNLLNGNAIKIEISREGYRKSLARFLMAAYGVGSKEAVTAAGNIDYADRLRFAEFNLGNGRHLCRVEW